MQDFVGTRAHAAGRWRRAVIGVAAAALLATSAEAQNKSAKTAAAPAQKAFTLVVSESLRGSGFLQYLRPIFEKQHGVRVNIVASKTGQALSRIERGEADAALIDDFEGERRVVAAGHGTSRNDVMYGELIVVGPEDDPAGVRGMVSVIEALKLVARAESAFLSRGDDSGVDRAERRYWEEAGIDAGGDNAAWYKVTGADMAATLGIAAKQNAYTITDRAAWLGFKTRGRLEVVVADDPRMIHQFGIIPVNPKKHKRVNSEAAAIFVQWLGTAAAQEAIAKFTVAGEAPYIPNFGQRSRDDNNGASTKKSKKKRKR